MTEPGDIFADLVGLSEIAAGLGVGVHRVRRWIERAEATGCPRPVRVLKCGAIYSMAEWKGWHALWKMTRGSELWNDGQGRGNSTRSGNGCSP